MNTNIVIPDKIKVGYQNRQDTYSKKLAYVIYYDNKNELRKEKSWAGWRDDNFFTTNLNVKKETTYLVENLFNINI